MNTEQAYETTFSTFIRTFKNALLKLDTTFKQFYCFILTMQKESRKVNSYGTLFEHVKLKREST